MTIGLPIEDLPTPAVLVDLDVLERNISRQALRASSAGVRLRPHAKTHKCPEIARLQLEAGAAGISLAKTSEAEVFADAGFEDIFIAYPVVGLGKAERLLALSDRLRLAAGLDSVEGAAWLSDVFSAAGRRLDVLVKIDCGYHRVGIPPETALAFVEQLGDFPGVRLRGIFTHAGHVYGAQKTEDVAEIGTKEGEILAQTAVTLEKAGVSVEEVSVGSTPSARYAMRVAGVTECRPGNYVFHDGSQVALGTCDPEDCAMTILATVVSVPASDRAVVDAGSKTLSQDPLKPRANGNGLILGTRTRLVSLTEEHGVASVEEGDSFRVGDRVRILPNHACVVSNLHDRLYGVRAGRIETEFRIAARGRIE
jgi:D-serine deaminase-like pyridoxal phosphate-dependent protein